MTNETISNSNWTDPDDAPALDAEWFETADAYRGDKLVRRGRPRSSNPKQLVSLRLDPDVLEGLRAWGPRWQTRVNAELRKLVGI